MCVCPVGPVGGGLEQCVICSTSYSSSLTWCSFMLWTDAHLRQAMRTSDVSDYSGQMLSPRNPFQEVAIMNVNQNICCVLVILLKTLC